MIRTVKGLVLRSTKYDEFDRLITVLSEEGKFFFRARGIRSVTSRNAAGCQPFVYSEFVLREKGQQCTLDRAQPLFTTLKAGADIVSLSLASYFAELCEDSARDAETGKAALRLLMNALYLLSKEDRPGEWIKAVFELRLLAANGLIPLFGECGECGKETNGETALYFRPTEGDFVCRECLSSRDRGAFPVSRRAIVLAERSVSAPENEAYALKIDGETLKEFSLFSERFLLSQMERTYKTLEFYRQISHLPEAGREANPIPDEQNGEPDGKI